MWSDQAGFRRPVPILIKPIVQEFVWILTTRAPVPDRWINWARIPSHSHWACQRVRSPMCSISRGDVRGGDTERVSVSNGGFTWWVGNNGFQVRRRGLPGSIESMCDPRRDRSHAPGPVPGKPSQASRRDGSESVMSLMPDPAFPGHLIHAIGRPRRIGAPGSSAFLKRQQRGLG